MFSCCCFCSGKFKSPRTEHLSRPPLLPPLPSESSYLLSCIILLLLPHIASFFKSLLSSQRSRTSLVTLTSLRMDLTHRKKQLVKLTNSFYFVFKNIFFWYGYVSVSLIVCFFQCWLQCLLARRIPLRDVKVCLKWGSQVSPPQLGKTARLKGSL